MIDLLVLRHQRILKKKKTKSWEIRITDSLLLSLVLSHVGFLGVGRAKRSSEALNKATLSSLVAPKGHQFHKSDAIKLG